MVGLRKYLTGYHLMKGRLFAFLGLATAVTIHWGPVAVGLYLIFGEGEILTGILFPFLWWLILAWYFALLPLWWIIGIFKYGFIESTLSCLLILGIFSLPDVFFWLANRQMEKRSKLEGVSPDKDTAEAHYMGYKSEAVIEDFVGSTEDINHSQSAKRSSLLIG